MTASVLDASALLALLLDEPGASRVRGAMATASISVTLSEVVAHLTRLRVLPEDPISILNRLPLMVVPFDRIQAQDAGTLIVATRSAGLSPGDRACLTLARARGWPALTADHAWLGVAAAIGVTVEMIR